jgi:lipopolysaccharide transport system ATP-binding protein
VSEPAVAFDEVWKKFRSGERHDSLRDLIPAMVKSMASRRAADLEGQEFWALENVSFHVPRGRALGIIGPNGAGKSTVLKLLTKILRPTRGHCQVRGRVGALIEVAAGFHPDLTGRENVYLQGAVMGMKGREVSARFDEIVTFAGVEAFIDTPIKRYSSGMNARLGFSIAAHLNPDVLIIDEVLSVGDMAFQERCLERMRGFKKSGVTIVFVSHNLQAVTDLCDEALYLSRQVRALGPSGQVVGQYVRDTFTAPASVTSGTGLRIVSSVLTDEFGGEITGPVSSGSQLVLHVAFEAATALTELGLAFRVLRSTDQILVYDGQFSQSELGLTIDRAGPFTLSFAFDATLTRGQYYFDVLVGHVPTQRDLTRLTPAGHLTVVETRTWGGIANLMVSPQVKRGAPVVAAVRR